ncbi:hypothetical protein D7X33_05470 [Butyricicoccus sp. 1XD8-22]|nr:hypothetical protein D7X33_05470 [Butyricicoccus sp. 1XD8-22]
MKTHLRMLSALTAASMLFSAVPPAGAVRTPPAAPVYAADAGTAAATGEIRVRLRLDFEQPAKVLKERDVTVTLEKGNQVIDSVELGDADGTPDGKYGLVRKTLEEGVECIDLCFGGLETGEYKLEFTGEGYKDCPVEVELDKYSAYIVAGTGDASFTLGDFDGNGKVDGDDLKAVQAEAGKGAKANLDYDLDGDGKVDISDVAYVNHCMAAIKDYTAAQADSPVVVLYTDLIGAPAVQAEDGTTAETPSDNGFTKFTAPENSDIKFSAAAEDGTAGIDAQQVNIVTSSTQGTIADGSVLVEYMDGEKETIQFTDGIPKDIQLMSIDGDEGHKVITINLGRRVPVKKITVTVTRTEKGEFASVAAVEFLKDIVPENPMPKYIAVQNLAAEPANESVTLKWGALPNVTGYEVVYYQNDKPADKSTLHVDTTAQAVSGLTNLKEYTFEVTPVADGGWRGEMRSIGATPQPSGPPAKVNMVNVTARDAQLDVSWKAGKNATDYAVYYTNQENAALNTYTKAADGLTTTSTSITGLENGTTYYIYVTAHNSMGVGPASNIVTGTPKAVDYSEPAGIPAPEARVPREKIKSIRLLDPNNVSDKTFQPEQLIDGDYKTSWTARNWSSNEHVEVTFTEPVDLSAAIWVPRLDGDYPKWLRAYAVRVWLEGDPDDFTDTDKLPGRLIVPDPTGGGVDRYALGSDSDMQTWPGVRGNPAQSNFAILPFGPLKGITKIQVAVEQMSYNLTSMSELIFLTYDEETDVPTLIEKLFTDNTFTALKDTATKEEIARIEGLLDAHANYYLYPDSYRDELALARKLLNGEPNDGVVLEGLHTTAGTKNYGQGGSVLQPLGAAAQAGKTITVYADIPPGETVELFATQANAEASAWKKSLGTLSSGRNVITIPKVGSQAGTSGGSLYYKYAGTQADKIRLHVRRGADIPMLDVVDWYDMNDDAKNKAISDYVAELGEYSCGKNAGDWNNVTEISTPTVLLSIPASSVKGASAEQLKNSILAWEDIMYICRSTQGIDAVRENSLNMAERQNIRCMQMFEGAFMYAAGEHIGIGAGSCAGMVNGTPVPAGGVAGESNGLFGWGIAHEIGHNMDRLGKAEITNNIYSIMVQTYDGKQNTLKSRLEKSNKYPAIFTKVAQQYAGASGDVFVQLGMYWQLHLAYDGGTSPDQGFFNEFMTAWKNGTYTAGVTSYDDKVALTAAGVTGKNLTEFFKRWGMVLSESTKAVLEGKTTEDRAIWYLNDQSRRDRLNKVAGVDQNATVSVKAEMAKTETGEASKTDVKLTITPSGINSGKVQGYEILRNGTPIDFIIAGADGSATYTDAIGSANHRTFEYAVNAYDSLGNEFAKEVAADQEIRIAYDMTLKDDEYESRTVAGGTATITLKAETPISGILLDKWNNGDEFTVTVTDGSSKETVACSGTFSAANNQVVDTVGSYLAYLRKPGAADGDTRIWTYDAKTVKITGVPDGANVQLISYAGDDVAFLSGATVGKLAKDYTYTDADNKEQTIKAGTLVVLGTYRGDPVYNTLALKGEFVNTSISDESGEVKQVTVEREVSGYFLMLAEVPKDGEVSDISDGFFLFVPNLEAEKELQEGKPSDCRGESLLPARMKITLYRTDNPDGTGSKRITAETVWIHSPGGTDLPTVELKTEVAE